MLICIIYGMEKITDEMERRISTLFEGLREKRGWSYQDLGNIAFEAMADRKAKAYNLLKNKTHYTFPDFCKLCIVFGLDPAREFLKHYDASLESVEDSNEWQELREKATAYQPKRKHVKKSNQAAA